jgi:hypothetical protein
MDFLLFLTPINKAIVNDLIKAKFLFVENAAICSANPRYFGFLHKDRSFIVCTNNIIDAEDNPRFWINQTVTHEAVHAAQNCKKGSLGYKTENMPLSYKKVQFLMASTSVSKEFHKEHEAYYLEDSPKLVLSYIKKFCF